MYKENQKSPFLFLFTILISLLTLFYVFFQIGRAYDKKETIIIIDEYRLADITDWCIDYESGGKDNAYNPNGATGILQIKPIFIKEYFQRYYEVYGLTKEEAEHISYDKESSIRIFERTLREEPDFAVKSWDCLIKLFN